MKVPRVRTGLVLALGVLWGPAPIHPRAAAQGSPPAGVAARRIENRVRLWAAFADGTAPLSARFDLTRYTALAREPYQATGRLTTTPSGDRVELVPDEGRGATTVFHRSGAVELRRAREAHPRPLDDPASRWLSGLLLRILLPEAEDTAYLSGDDRITVPRGRGMKIEFRPPQDHPARDVFRAVTIHLDPVAGFVARIEIFETSGDRIDLRLSDVHRPPPAP